MSTSLQYSNPLAPGESLEAYINTINGIPLLTLEEESSLVREIYYNQDLIAARKIVLAHLRFVVHIARSYSGYGLAQADLIQEGNVGLMKAVKRFNPELGVRLVSFAIHWIKAEIHEFILRNWRIVKIATTKAQRKLFFNLRRQKKSLAWFNKDEINNVAKSLGVAPQEVREMESRLTGKDVSFDPIVDDEDTAFLSPANNLEDNKNNPEILVEQSDWIRKSTKKLYSAMKNLDSRSRDILSQRWLLNETLTLDKLARKYRVSPERIRQLEKSAMHKLKHLMSTRAL